MSYKDFRSHRSSVVFLPADEFSVERVFPIRNLVNDAVDETQGSGEDVSRVGADVQSGTSVSAGTAAQSLLRGGTAADIEESKRKDDSAEAVNIPSPETSIPPPTIRRLTTTPPNTEPSVTNDGEVRQVSERSQFVPAEDGPPQVLPGVVGEQTKSAFYRCEDEPIRIPGAIQAFGALVAMKYNLEGNLECRICSENCRDILGYRPEELFKLNSFFDILEANDRKEMAARISYALDNPSKPNEDTQLDIFNTWITLLDGSRIRLWCAMHALDRGYVVFEFEEYSDAFYLRQPEDVQLLPKTPITAVDMQFSPEEMRKSTTSGSTPLKALGMARWRQQSGFFSMDIFNAMTQAQQQLAASFTVQQVLDVVVGIIAELTNFHRVMFYRFDELMNGSIEAELVNPDASSDLFRGKHTRLSNCSHPNACIGLNFPASDIPKQAQELYKINRIRVLHDRDAETARLVSRAFSVTPFKERTSRLMDLIGQPRCS